MSFDADNVYLFRDNSTISCFNLGLNICSQLLLLISIMITYGWVGNIGIEPIHIHYKHHDVHKNHFPGDLKMIRVMAPFLPELPTMHHYTKRGVI